jgi:GH35 family endo-1,4-beta-xylanase
MRQREPRIAGRAQSPVPGPGSQALGERRIDLALTTAHQAGPHSDLFINEYGAEKDVERREALFTLAERLRARGVPIDGIGFQKNHEYEKGDRTAAETFRRRVRELASIGSKARVSETDAVPGGGVAGRAGSSVRRHARRVRRRAELPGLRSVGVHRQVLVNGRDR